MLWMRPLPSLVCLILVAGMIRSASAVSWSDDFNDGNAEDGNPVTWTYNELGVTPGMYVASSGDYSLSAPGGSNNDSLIASVNVSFTNTYIRTQAVVLPGSLPEEVDGTLGVVARWDPLSLSGYAAILSTGSHLELLRVDGGVPTDLIEARNLEVDTLTDALIELNVVGDELSVYLWRPDTPKPDTPVVNINDASYSSGRGGILHNENDDNTLGVFRFAAAQDTPFVEGLKGDYNHNGVVDAADYVVWRDGLGGPFGPQDYDIWKANFGAALGAGNHLATSIPEPASLVSILLMLIGRTLQHPHRRVH
jgi:hypothetical protein